MPPRGRAEETGRLMTETQGESTSRARRGSAKKRAAAKSRAAKPAAKPASAAPPSPEVQAAATAAAEARDHHRLLELLSPAQRAEMEQLSLNLARAAMTAQGAIAEAALRQADRPAALSPDPFHVAPALSEVMARLAAQPDRLMRAQADLFGRYMDLWKETTHRLHGQTYEPVAQPAKGDKRFADPDWTNNPLFDVI